MKISDLPTILLKDMISSNNNETRLKKFACAQMWKKLERLASK